MRTCQVRGRGGEQGGGSHPHAPAHTLRGPNGGGAAEGSDTLLDTRRCGQVSQVWVPISGTGQRLSSAFAAAAVVASAAAVQKLPMSAMVYSKAGLTHASQHAPQSALGKAASS